MFNIAVSVVLIYLIKKINVIIFFINNCLSVFFDPRLIIMEFMIEQMIVLWLGNISFFAHDYRYKIERTDCICRSAPSVNDHETTTRSRTILALSPRDLVQALPADIKKPRTCEAW